MVRTKQALIKEYYIENPWAKTYKHIIYRCGKSREYGKRGIKNYLQSKDLKYLWYRDKAYLMELPSIDRINTGGHYSLSNCRYIEYEENKKRKRTKSTHCKRGHIRNAKNNRINKRGFAVCKICYNEYKGKWLKKKNLKSNYATKRS